MSSAVKTILTMLVSTFILVSAHALAFTDQNADQPYEDALESFYLSELNTAIIHLKNALKNDPKHLPSMVLLAEVYLAKGNGAAAENQLENAQDNNADENKILPLMLEAYLLQQKYKQVINASTAAVQQKKLLAKIAILQGRALIATNNLEQAKRSFKKALEQAPNNVKAQLGIAQIYLLNGNVHQTRVYLNKALAISPTNSIALVMLANLEQQDGNIGESLKIISQVIELNNKDFPALLTRASLYIEQKKFQLALNDVAVIITEIPNEPKANYLKIIANSALGNTKEAKETTAHINTVLMGLPEDIMQQNPVYLYLAGIVSFQQQESLKAQDFLQKYINIINNDPRALKLLAQVELSLNNPFIAKTLLVKAKLISPKDIETWSLLGQVYAQLGEFELAEKYFIDVVNKEKIAAEPLYDLAKLEVLVGKFPQAIEHLKRAKSIDNNVEILSLLAEAYQKNNQLEQSLKQLDQALLQQDNSSLHLHKGIVLGQLNKHILAKESLTTSLRLAPLNLEAFVHLTRIDVVENHADKAISKINKKLIELENPSPFLLIELGNIYRLNKNNEAALKAYNKAFSLDNNNPTALISIIETQVMLGQLKQAISLTNDFLDRNNKVGDIYLALANLYMADKAYDKAFSTFQIAVKNSNNKSAVYNLFAKAQLSRFDHEGAILSLKRSISWNSENVDAYLALFNIYQDQKSEQLALDVLKKITARTSNQVFLKNIEGDLYRKLGQLTSAEKLYKTSIDMRQNQPAVYGLYRVYKQQKQFSKALNLLNHWVSKNPGDIASHIAIADTLVATKQLQKAADKYQNLISKFSSIPILLNNAAQVFIKLNQLNTAQEYAKKAYDALPNNVAIMDTLAWTYTLNNQAKLALPLFRKAIIKDFNNAEIKYHLAVALSQLGRNAEAKKYLREAIDSENNFIGKQDALTLKNKLSKT
jgi:putative PEP-CTERM system TPR-repeat lipoprotein